MPNKVMLIGAGSGIGQAVAKDLDEQGWLVYGTYRSDSSAFRGEHTMGIAGDMTFDVRDRRAIGDHMRTLAPLDSVIWCVGAVEPKPLIDTDTDEAREGMEVNYLAAHEMIKVALELAVPKVVVLTSSAGLTARPGWTTYSAAKAALCNLVESVAPEFDYYGGKVFNIAPGRCATALRARLAPTEDPNSIMQPLEVAKVISFCLSDYGDVLATYPIRVHGGAY